MCVAPTRRWPTDGSEQRCILPGVPRVKKVPGSAAAPHALTTATEQPALARDRASVAAAGDEQAPRPSTGRSADVQRSLWLLVLLGLTVALAILRETGAPSLLLQSLAATLAVMLAIGLALRSGGRVPVAAALAIVLAVVTVATRWPPLLAGAAIATAVLAASLAVLGTRPAHRLRSIVPEVVLAQLVALSGALGAAGFSVGVEQERFGYTVLGLALLATVALVYRLGGGLHGLGRRGLVLYAMELVLLGVVLVYTAALTKYGSPDLVEQVRSAQDWTREHLGGVPRPLEVTVGIPALAWGVVMRARRRQGWWVCVFGVAATAATASSLVAPDSSLSVAALSAAYSVVLGLVVGAAVIRLEHLIVGRERRRAGSADDAERREEPKRLHPLH